MAIHHMILVMVTKCMTDSLIAVKEFVQIRRIVFKQGIFSSNLSGPKNSRSRTNSSSAYLLYFLHFFIYNSVDKNLM